MRLFKRFSLILNASIDELIDRVEDPELTMKRLIREMEHNLSEAKSQVVDAMLHEKQLQEQLIQEQQSEAHWYDKARAALQQTHETQAREALFRKQTHSELIKAIEPSLTTAKTTTAHLKQQLIALESKLKEVNLKRTTLMARENALKAQKKMGIEQKRYTEALDERLKTMEDRVFDQESRQAAMEALEVELNPVEFAVMDMKQERAIEADLEQLKQSLATRD